jgi:hypothetical protein
MSSLRERIADAGRCIERLKRHIRQQTDFIDCLERNGFDVTRARQALEAMQAELLLQQRYRVSLCQEAAFVDEPREKVS